MMILATSLCFLLCGAAVFAGVERYDVDTPTQQDRTGIMNDGDWWCSWQLSGFECRDGHFNCRCPSNNQAVYFYVGCCYKFPECGVICNTHDCSRYYHCESCRNQIGEWDPHSCNTCKKGFVLGQGDCKEDYDECSVMNGNCDQRCHNSYGSYSCACNSGYSLNEDQLTCRRLSCSEPDTIEHGAVAATESWLYNSYARYSCEAPHTLLGPAYRQCLADGEHLYWQHDQPRCIDVCDNVPLEQRRSCGSSLISSAQCAELGCCYREADTGPRCFSKPVPLYLSYAGDRPKPNDGQGFETLQDYSIEGCGVTCSLGSLLRCKGFGLDRTSYDTDQRVQRQTCHLMDKSRRQLEAEGELWHGDPDYDFYDQLYLDASRLKSKSHGGAKEAPGQFNGIEEKLYDGCYGDDAKHRDLEHFVWRDARNTPSRCIGTCRQQGFSFAGLQNGNECYCSNSISRIYDVSEGCTSICTGDLTAFCGGPTANSVYRVPASPQYMGCYTDDPADPDLPTVLWTEFETQSRSASNCVQACRAAGFSYAGLQSGGRCQCGQDYGRHGDAAEEECGLICPGGWINENCGGEKANAIYNTERGLNLDVDAYDGQTRKIFINDDYLNGVPLTLFTEFPQLKSIISKRVILHATEGIYSPSEALACSGDCYTRCGQIYHPPGLEYKGKDLTLRFFHLNLRDLQSYVGVDAERVFVYAQTVLIEDLLQFDFSLQIRARQIIINRGRAPILFVGSKSPIFDHDWDVVKDAGPDSDDLFTKQSFMCARIILDARVREEANIAWGILYDLTRGYDPTNEEKTAWAHSIRMFNSFLSGIDRQNLYFVPFYSKSYFSEILRLYYDQITIYKNDYDRLLDDALSQAEYVRTVEEMLLIQTKTDIMEAQSSFNAALAGVLRSNATYYRFKAEYDLSRVEMDKAQIVFEDSLQKQRSIAAAVLPWVQALQKVFQGIKAIKAWKLQKDLETALMTQLDLLADSMDNLAASVEETERFMELSDVVLRNLEDPTSDFDYTRFMADIETTVAMQVNVVRWKNLKNNVIVILTNPEVTSYLGCFEYMRTVLDVINWGEAVTRSTVEHAEIMRDCIQRKYALDSKLRQAERYEEYLDELKAGAISRQLMTMHMAEQQYDVRLDLNNVLMSFCQAYFYENMYECKDSYKPAFGGSLSELLMKINLALMDSILIPNPPSTVSRIVRIVDTDTTPDCADFTRCPVRKFRDTGIFHYNLLINNSYLIDLDRYRVHEILLTFVGAKSNPVTFNDIMKVRIESSGAFQGREKGTVYNFITRALSLTYEYSLDTGHISIRANVYEPYRDTIQHITPYTTWVMRLSELSADIDISEVTMVTMRLDGSAFDNEAKKLGEAQPTLLKEN